MTHITVNHNVFVLLFSFQLTKSFDFSLSHAYKKLKLTLIKKYSLYLQFGHRRKGNTFWIEVKIISINIRSVVDEISLLFAVFRNAAVFIGSNSSPSWS